MCYKNKGNLIGAPKEFRLVYSSTILLHKGVLQNNRTGFRYNKLDTLLILCILLKKTVKPSPSGGCH